jgi:hypothetical protein
MIWAKLQTLSIGHQVRYRPKIIVNYSMGAEFIEWVKTKPVEMASWQDDQE